MWFQSKEKNREQADKLLEKARQAREKENILEALESVEKAIHLDKEYATSYGEYGIVLALEKNNFERAEYNGQLAVIKDSKNAVQWRNLAHTYYLLGKYQKAFVTILVAETLNPQLENVQKLKSLIKAIMNAEQLKTLDIIEEKTKQVFSKFQKEDVIMPDLFLQETLNI